MVRLAIDDAAVLRGGDGDPADPLVLLLHGFGSHEGDLPPVMPHLPGELAWASLRAPLDLPSGGHAWFPITVPGRPDPSTVASAADAVLDWVDGHVEAATPVVLLGFSQGGTLVTQLLRRRPDHFAAGVVLSGFVVGAELPGDAALAGTRPPVFYGRGDADRVIAADAVARTDAWLPGHATLDRHVYPGLGHGISPAELADVSAFLTGALRAPAGVDGQVTLDRP